MKNIMDLGSDVSIEVSDKPSYKGNEAELISAKIKYKEIIKGIITNKQEDYLLRKCMVGCQDLHNKELEEIFQKLKSININYKSQGIDYRLKIIDHLKDNLGNIYIKNINTEENSFNVYDLLPDGYYIDPNKKAKSKFKDFKKAVRELRLNELFIIPNIFEQLAILHANNFVVGELVIGEKRIKHPTLSLFLYKLKNKKGDVNEEIYIHDIHNLKELSDNTSRDYINHCVKDIKTLSFDIIRFFKGVGLPQGGMITYSKVLKKLNPELYKIMYNTFLYDPKIEIEISAMENSYSEDKKERKTGKKVVENLKGTKKGKNDKMKSFFSQEDIFYFPKSRDKFIDFFDSMSPENTEIIIDFDNTMTYPGSLNALNIAFNDNGEFNPDYEFNYEDFMLRIGVGPFIKMLLLKKFKVKIYSLGLKDVIYKVLRNNSINIQEEDIFGNETRAIMKEKRYLGLKLHKNKKKLIIGDNIEDFEIENIGKNDLKIGFLNSDIRKPSAKKILLFNDKLDLYYIRENSNFLGLYNIVNSL